MLMTVLHDAGIDPNAYTFIEPSAGSGNFITTSPIPLSQWRYYDIDPDNITSDLSDGLTVHDYLTLPPSPEHVITVGNPPFGKRSALAVDFVNHAYESSDVIAFILPVQFDKYLTQSRLDRDLDLVLAEHLVPESFSSPDGTDIDHLRTGFYVFIRHELNPLPDLRVRNALPTTHRDFQLWQYNCTPEARKYFNKDEYQWDFAVLRQGYGDYHELIADAASLSTRKQYMFLKGSTPVITDRLRNMDYEALARLNTSIPGFGKADLIAAYNALYPPVSEYEQHALL